MSKPQLVHVPAYNYLRVSVTEGTATLSTSHNGSGGTVATPEKPARVGPFTSATSYYVTGGGQIDFIPEPNAKRLEEAPRMTVDLGPMQKQIDELRSIVRNIQNTPASPDSGLRDEVSGIRKQVQEIKSSKSDWVREALETFKQSEVPSAPIQADADAHPVLEEVLSRLSRIEEQFTQLSIPDEYDETELRGEVEQMGEHFSERYDTSKAEQERIEAKLDNTIKEIGVSFSDQDTLLRFVFKIMGPEIVRHANTSMDFPENAWTDDEKRVIKKYNLLGNTVKDNEG